MHLLACLSAKGYFEYFLRSSRWMADKGNQMAARVNHVLIGPYNGKTIWYVFHTWRVIGTVKSIRRGDRAVIGMIWKKQVQLHPRMMCFCKNNRLRSQAIKLPVVPNIKGGNTMHNNVLLHRLAQLAKNRTGRVPVSYEKASFLHEVHHPSVHLFYIRIIRI